MSDQVSPEITSDDKLLAALAYVFPILAPIIIMLMDDKKDRPYLRSHYFQALVAGVALVVLTPITFGCFSVFWFAMLYWAYQAYQGEKVTIPVITDFVKNQGWV